MMPSDMLSGANVVLIAIILTVTGAIKSIFPDCFGSKTGQRILPIIPIVLGIAGALAGLGSPGAAATILDKVMVGLMSGLSAAISFKLARTTVLGKGIDAK